MLPRAAVEIPQGGTGEVFSLVPGTQWPLGSTYVNINQGPGVRNYQRRCQKVISEMQNRAAKEGTRRGGRWYVKPEIRGLEEAPRLHQRPGCHTAPVATELLQRQGLWTAKRSGEQWHG